MHILDLKIIVRALCVWLVSSFAWSASMEAELTPLSQHKAWQNLLYYRSSWFGLRHTTQADDPQFLLAADAGDDPLTELQAFWVALQGPYAKETRCRFPARYFWLQKQFPVQLPAMNPGDCPALMNWLDEVNGHSVTLVYVASSFDSPSSLLGQIYLRVDPEEVDEDNLVSSSVIRYLPWGMGHDNVPLETYQQLVGAKGGSTVLEPYGPKIEHEMAAENRDRWEYRLNLTPEEVQLLLLAVWEIRGLRFDYYYLDENGGSRLLALLDIARPSLDLGEKLSSVRALPLDALRLVTSAELVARVKYRPSPATTAAYAISQLSEKQRDALEALMREPWSRAFLSADYWKETRLNATEIVAVLETAYDLNRYRIANEKLPREPYAAFSYNLLKARSQYPEHFEHPAVLEPAREDQGHPPFRLTVAGGMREDKGFMELEFRPAYHDLTDPALGYRAGAHLEAMTLALRGYDGFRDIEVEHLKLLELYSLNPQDLFFDPWSWQFGIGGRRAFESPESRPFVAYLEGGLGPSWALGNQIWSLLFKAEGEPSTRLPDGGRLEGGIEVNWLYRSENYRGHLSANQRADVIQKGLLRTRIIAEFYYDVMPGITLGIKGRFDDSGQADAYEGALVSQFFF